MTSLAELVALVRAQTDPKWAFQLLCDGLGELIAQGQAIAVGSTMRPVREGEEPAPGGDAALSEGKARA